ncbi:hypothetical protein YC2023_072947 [Brassica napus]
MRLRVELSILVPQSMFLTEARSVFCHDSPMLERMINVIHYVYFKFIEPKNGVYHINGMSVLRLDISTLWNYNYVIVSQNIIVWILRGEAIFTCDWDFMSSIEEQLKQSKEKLRCGKTVSEANEIRREAIECNIFGLRKSLFDKEYNEATQTLKSINNRILHDLFVPQQNQVAPQPN